MPKESEEMLEQDRVSTPSRIKEGGVEVPVQKQHSDSPRQYG